MGFSDGRTPPIPLKLISELALVLARFAPFICLPVRAVALTQLCNGVSDGHFLPIRSRMCNTDFISGSFYAIAVSNGRSDMRFVPS